MKTKTDLEQINERIVRVSEQLVVLVDKKEIVDKLVHKKLFGISFLVYGNTACLLNEQEELQNTITYLRDYKGMLLEQYDEIESTFKK